RFFDVVTTRTANSGAIRQTNVELATGLFGARHAVGALLDPVAVNARDHPFRELRMHGGTSLRGAFFARCASRGVVTRSRGVADGVAVGSARVDGRAGTRRARLTGHGDRSAGTPIPVRRSSRVSSDTTRAETAG